MFGGVFCKPEVQYKYTERSNYVDNTRTSATSWHSGPDNAISRCDGSSSVTTWLDLEPP